MRFNCGKTREEKLLDLHQWHKRFALFPFRVEGVCVWLEFYERRCTKYSETWVSDFYEWEYRLK